MRALMLGSFLRTVHLGIVTFCLFSSTSLYANIIVLNDNMDEYNILGNEVEIFEDPTNEKDFLDVLSQKPGVHFYSNRDAEQFSSHSSSNYWLKFKVRNNCRENKWILEILDSRFNQVIFYAPDPSHPGAYLSSVTGTKYPFSQREYQHKNFVFDFPLVQGDAYYFLKVEPGVTGSFLFKIRKNKIFSSYGFKEYLLLGMYYGILLIMAFYNLFLYFTIKEKVYIYYFFYVLAWAFNSTIDDGLGFQFLWSEIPYIPIIGIYSSKILMLTFYILYSQSFLDIKHNYPSLRNRLYQILLVFIILNSIFTYFHITFLLNLLFVSIFAYILYIAYLVYKRGYKPARFFLLGNSIIVAGLIIYMLKNAALFDGFIKVFPGLLTMMVYIHNLIMVADIVILSIALGDRIRYMKQATEKAQEEVINHLNEKKALSEKVNKELEAKVKERTKTIEEKNQLLVDANLKLQIQAEEINKMNALLDIDNWNLKKNIIEEKEARLIQKEIDFKEFNVVYPNEASCFKFIEDIKWQNGFKCKKCGNIKYGKGYSTFSRRCSKCRYDESITAYTIFHKCKFDIRIALYIAVLINRYGNDISITEISKEVNLRNATCWKFVQKLLSGRAQKEYQQLNDNEKLTYLLLQSPID